jgi:hypothetical protein
MSELDENDWTKLIDRLATGKCTVALGRGACASSPPEGGDPAVGKFAYPMHAERCRQWAAEVGYPFSNPDEFDRVAQFVSIDNDRLAPKEFIEGLFQNASPPDFSRENEPHRVLAELPIPIYLTTNLDSFLSQALQRKPEKDAFLRICPWNKHLPEDLEVYQVKGPEPTVANPLVYHFLGRWDYLESIAVAEDDHYEFLMNLARDEVTLLNHRVQRALKNTTLLLVGYSLHDREFLLLLRLLGHFLRESYSTHVAVQLAPSTAPGSDAQKALKYLDRYFQHFNIRVYRGDCQQFVTELWRRWQARPAASPQP